MKTETKKALLFSAKITGIVFIAQLMVLLNEYIIKRLNSVFEGDYTLIVFGVVLILTAICSCFAILSFETEKEEELKSDAEAHESKEAQKAKLRYENYRKRVANLKATKQKAMR